MYKLINGYHYHGSPKGLCLQLLKPYNWVITKQTKSRDRIKPGKLVTVASNVPNSPNMSTSVLVAYVFKADTSKLIHQGLHQNFKPVLSGSHKRHSPLEKKLARMFKFYLRAKKYCTKKSKRIIGVYRREYHGDRYYNLNLFDHTTIHHATLKKLKNDPNLRY